MCNNSPTEDFIDKFDYEDHIRSPDFDKDLTLSDSSLKELTSLINYLRAKADMLCEMSSRLLEEAKKL